MFTSWDKISEDIIFTIQPNLEETIYLLNKKSRILDFGCGYGRIGQKLWLNGYKNTIGYGSSLSMIKRGNQEHPFLNLRFNKSNKIPEKTESFDAVILCATLTCIPCIQHRVEIIVEIYRVLKFGGKIVISEFAKIKEKSYSRQGTFKSSLGITMKHFDKKETLNELGIFRNHHIATMQTKTLNGSPAKAISYQGEK